MHACGNDYIYISLFGQSLAEPHALAVRMSDRHTGIGSDGLVLVCPSDIADFRMRIFNPDGTEAEMCGNALRSSSVFAYDKKIVSKPELTVETLGGIKRVSLEIRNGRCTGVSANIGIPSLDAESVPVLLTNKGNSLIGCRTVIEGRDFLLTALSLGNPHCAAETCGMSNFTASDVEKYGRALEYSPLFPKKTNAHFYEVIDRTHIVMRSWERGCGETMACATGCTACVYAAILSGKLENSAEVIQPGGVIRITREPDGSMVMSGNCETVYDGVIRCLT